MARRKPESLEARYQARYPERGPLPPRSVAEEDARAAATALEAGEVEAAVRALAGALLVDPFDRDWLALLDRVLATEGAGLALDRGGAPWCGIEGLRAHARAARGDVEGALEDLIALSQDALRPRFLEAWAPRWLEAAIEDVDPALAERTLRTLAGLFPDPPHVAHDAPAILGAAVTLLDRLERAHGPNDGTAIARGMMLARAGRLDEAIRATTERATRAPTTMTLTAAAMAHKRAGDVDAAIVWLERAAAHEPTYPGCLLDIGDLHLEAGRFDRALAAYEEALRRQPDHDWATPSAEYCRHRLGDVAALAALRQMANGAQCTCGGAAGLRSLRGGYSYDDRQHRAEALIRRIEPDFVRRPVEIVH